MDEEMKLCLLDLVDRNPFASLTILNQQLRTALPQKAEVSVATIARVLDGNLITCKIAGKDADVPARRNQPITILRRQEYAQFFTQLGLFDNIVYVDESGYNIFTRRS